jgi:hypothetical protein
MSASISFCVEYLGPEIPQVLIAAESYGGDGVPPESVHPSLC